MSKCKYTIKLPDGSLLEIPSDNLLGNRKEFEKALLDWVMEKGEDTLTQDLDAINAIDKQVVVPEMITETIIGQNSLNNLYLLGESAEQLVHLKRIVRNNFKNTNLLSKENILVTSLPEEYSYIYLSDQDIILINNSLGTKQSSYIKGIVDSLAYKYAELNNIDNPLNLILNRDKNFLDFIGIGEKSFTRDSFEYTYFGDSIIKDPSFIQEINKIKEKSKEVKEKYFDNFKDAQDLNYSLEDNYHISELNPGDIITNWRNSKKYYSLFVDYYIDENGQYWVKSFDSNSEELSTKRVNENITGRKVIENYIPENYEIKTDLGYLQINPSFNTEDNYSKNKFLKENLKRGDKVRIKTKSSDEVREILNIQGSTIFYKVKNGTSKTSNLSNITEVFLNKSHHSNILKYKNLSDSDFNNLFKEDDHFKYDKSIIKKEDIVLYNDQKWLVLDKLKNVLILYNPVTEVVENIGVSRIENHYINDGSTFKIKEQFDNNVENFDILATSFNEFEKSKLSYITSDFNIYNYNKAHRFQPSEYLLTNGKLFIITSIRNDFLRVYDGTNFQNLEKSNIKEDSIIFTNAINDPKIEKDNLDKNSFFITQDPSKNIYESNTETRVFKHATIDKGLQFFGSERKDLTGYIDVTNEYIKNNNLDPNLPLYKHQDKNNIYIRKSEGLNRLKFNSDQFSLIFDELLPGAFLDLGNSKYWRTEKKLVDNWLVSYSYISNGKTRTLKKVIGKDALVYRVYTPYYWKNVNNKLNTLLNGSNNLEEGYKTSIEINPLKSYDSPELIVSMASLLESKFGVKINFIHNSELDQFSDIENINQVRAFVRNGEYFVNIDKADIAEPLHELLHMVLASMKYSDFDNYMTLVESISNHPLYNQITENYQEINSDILEETFVTLFSESVRRNILLEGVFTEEVFMNSIKKGIVEMFDLNNDLQNQSSYELLDSPVKDILFQFSSNLLQNQEEIYNTDNALKMMSLSGLYKKLLKEGNLKQQCNGM